MTEAPKKGKPGPRCSVESFSGDMIPTALSHPAAAISGQRRHANTFECITSVVF